MKKITPRLSATSSQVARLIAKHADLYVSRARQIYQTRKFGKKKPA